MAGTSTQLTVHTCCSNMYIQSFVLSGYYYNASSSPLLLRGAPDCSIDTVSELIREALQATASEGLAKSPYVAARVGFEPSTLRTKDAELTTEPPLSPIHG